MLLMRGAGTDLPPQHAHCCALYQQLCPYLQPCYKYMHVFGVVDLPQQQRRRTVDPKSPRGNVCSFSELERPYRPAAGYLRRSELKHDQIVYLRGRGHNLIVFPIVLRPTPCDLRFSHAHVLLIPPCAATARVCVSSGSFRRARPTSSIADRSLGTVYRTHICQKRRFRYTTPPGPAKLPTAGFGG